jgi:hypothetical protein
LTSVGILNSGSITSGFGNIDIGASYIDCGKVTSDIGGSQIQAALVLKGVELAGSSTFESYMLFSGGTSLFSTIYRDSVGGKDYIGWESYNQSDFSKTSIVLQEFGGSIGIGKTPSSSFKLDVNGDLQCNNMIPSSDNSYTLGNGSFRMSEIYSVNSTINTSSRLNKKNIKPIKLGSDFICKLKPVEYEWITNSHGRIHCGLIAEDVGELINKDKYSLYIDDNIQKEKDKRDQAYQKDQKDQKEHVKNYKEPNKNENLLGLRYTEFIPILIKGFQEQQQQINKLTQIIETLTSNKHKINNDNSNGNGNNNNNNNDNDDIPEQVPIQKEAQSTRPRGRPKIRLLQRKGTPSPPKTSRKK